MNNKLVSLLVIIGLFALTSGCSEPKPDGMPELYPVKLTFTQEGKPLVGASVLLVPESEELRRWGCGGLTDASGVIHLRTYGKYDGIAVGKYKITVSLIYSDAEEELKKHASDSPEYRALSTKNPPNQYIPKKYVDKKTTPFEIEVVAGKNAKTFDIPEKVKESQISGL